MKRKVLRTLALTALLGFVLWVVAIPLNLANWSSGETLSATKLNSINQAIENAIAKALDKGGDTMTGNLRVNGRIGVGTNPTRSVEVVGNRIRLRNSNSSKIIDLRADGNAVDVHTTTSDLFLRSEGAGHDIIMNPFGVDGKVGIGTEAPAADTLHVVGSSTGSSYAKHLVILENRGTNNADVLALSIGDKTPGANNNFISFYKDNGKDNYGRIESNAAGTGVTYNSSGGDFAEYLPKLNPKMELTAGQIVGLFGGQASLKTKGAERVSVVATAPAFLGNMPTDKNLEDTLAQIAFMGQVPVNIRGKVEAGDLIIASGKEDGTAYAVSPSEIALEDYPQLVGRALEDSNDKGLKQVLVMVGMQDTDTLHTLLAKKDEQINALEERLEKLETLLSQTQ